MQRMPRREDLPRPMRHRRLLPDNPPLPPPPPFRPQQLQLHPRTTAPSHRAEITPWREKKPQKSSGDRDFLTRLCSSRPDRETTIASPPRDRLRGPVQPRAEIPPPRIPHPPPTPRPTPR